MNCVTAMPSPAIDISEQDIVSAGSTRKFHDDLINGLHAMAQPLTILQAAIEMLRHPEITGVDQKHYLEISAEQIKRGCDLFSSVQGLVVSNVSQAQLAGFDLWELLEPAIQDQTPRLENSGVGLAVARPEPWPTVIGDAERTEQAFRTVMKTALMTASRGDVIEIRTSRRHGFAEVAVMNTHSHGRRFSSSDRLCMSLAQINIVSQKGRCGCTDDPFSFWFALPGEHAAQPQPLTERPNPLKVKKALMSSTSAHPTIMPHTHGAER
jgi:hypothetical protein